jgi:rhodanese-related sulfurtransferase
MTATPPKPQVAVPGIDAPAAMSLVLQGASLLDVREQNEWDAGHAPGAYHVPFAVLATAVAVLPEGRPIVVVCRSGRRSTFAVAQLLEAGIEAANLDGGMQAWQLAGGDVVAATDITPAII